MVIRGVRWRVFRPKAEDAILEDRVDVAGVCAVDRWLAHREGSAVENLSAAEVLSFFADSISPNPIAKLVRALHAIDPLHPDLPVLSQAMELRSRSYRPARAPRARSRTPKVSVETRELPPDWLEALDAMRSGAHRGCRCPAPSIVVTIETKLRQLAFSARAAGLTPDFSVPVLGLCPCDARAGPQGAHHRVHARQAPHLRRVYRRSFARSEGHRRGAMVFRSPRFKGGQEQGPVPASIRS